MTSCASHTVEFFSPPAELHEQLVMAKYLSRSSGIVAFVVVSRPEFLINKLVLGDRCVNSREPDWFGAKRRQHALSHDMGR